jgi:hypothetical protein
VIDLMMLFQPQKLHSIEQVVQGGHLACRQGFSLACLKALIQLFKGWKTFEFWGNNT